jgi:uncharacterized protein (DUF427 family)
MKKVYIIFLSFILLSFYSYSQKVTNYSFVPASSTFTALSGGNTLTLNAGNMDDGYYNGVAIGFNFIYNSVSYSTVSISTNGFITLGQTIGNVNSQTNDLTNGVSPTSPRPILAPLWDDLNFYNTTDITYLTTGTSPNRVFTIQWLNTRWDYTANAGISFQLKLYELDDKIEFIYRPESGALVNPSASIGINGTTTGAGNFISIQSTGNNPYDTSTISENTSLSSKPSSGQRYAFVPKFGLPAAPASLSFSSLASTSMNVVWTDNTTNETYYKLYFSTDSVNYVLLSTLYSTTSLTTGTTYQYPVTGLSMGTQYYFKVFTGNEGSLSTNFVTGSQSTVAGTLSGIKTICPSGCYYTSIGAAATDIRNLGVNGSLILELDSTYNSSVETFPISFGALLTNASNVVTLRPRSNVSSLINFISVTSPTFDFNGTSFLTIDGRKGGVGTSSFINISNFNGGGTAIRFQNDAINNTITFCKISGASSSTNSGVINFLSTTGTLGNSNNTISNCIIKDTISNPIYSIYSSGNSNYPNINNVISNNQIIDYFNGSNSTYGIYLTTGSSAWTINNNHFYQTLPRTLSYNLAGAVYINSGASYTLNGNNIGGSASYCGGSPMNYNGTGNVIFLNLNMPTNNTCSVQNNTIQNMVIDLTGTSNFVINLANGDFNISGNTIGNTTSANSIRFTSTSTGTQFYPINLSTGTTYGAIVISSNTIGGISIGGSGTTFFKGINISVVVPSLTISSNIIGSLTTQNSITDSTNATLYGISTTLTSSSNSITGNIISNLTTYNTSTSNQIAGIYAASIGTFSIVGNSIKNLSTNSTSLSNGANAPLIGILLNASGANQVCSGNNVSGLFSSNTTLSQTLTGIHFQAGSTGTNIASKNFVHGIVSHTSGSAMIQGIINLSNGSTVYNNMVRLGIDTSGNDINENHQILGINDAGNSNSYYFNSVYIGGAAVGAGSNYTAAFCNSNFSTGTRSVLNNIFYNARSNNISSGKNYAIYLTTTSLTGLTISYNIYYTPGVGGTMGRYNAIDYAVLNTWRSTIFNDFNSAIGDPNFVSPASASSTLSLKVQSPTPADGSALLISGITDDLEGDNRSTLTPSDIGADAGNYTRVDIFSPVINYTNLTNTSITTTRTLVSNITDIGLGVKNGGSLQPRIWFRRSLPTASSWYSTPGTLTSGNVNNGTWTFTIDYSLIGGTVITGNQYQYYIVAQDSATPINLFYNPLQGTSHSNVFNQITPPTTPNSYSIVTGLATSINVGAGQTYTTLTGATGLFNAINTGALSGNTVATIVSDITEPGTVALFNTGMNGYTLTIKPDANPRLLSGATTTGYLGMLSVYGANGVIIDGGISKNLTIRNVIGSVPSATTAPAVYFYNGNNDTLRNCIIESNNGSGSYATVILGNSSIANPMSGMVITNNIIRPPSNINTNAPTVAMMVSSAAGNISNSTISANRIIDYTSYGLYIANSGNNLTIGHPTDTAQGNSFIQTANRGSHYDILVGSGDNHTISSNSFYNATGVSHTGLVLGIYLYNSINNATINNNNFGGCNKDRSGNSYLMNASYYGIYFYGGTLATSNITNNKFSNITLTGAYLFTGILIGSGNVNVSNNMIGGAAVTGNLFDAIYPSQDFYGIRHITSSNLTLSGNLISNVSNSGVGLTTCMSIEAGTAAISGNTIRDITVSNTNYTNADYSCNGIRLSTTTSGNNIENNTIFNLTNNSNTSSVSISGIAVMGAMNSSFVQRNRIYNLMVGSVNTGTNSPVIWGVYIGSTGNTTYANNQISINLSSATQPRIRGIELNTSGGSNNFYYNSVYIGGASGGANTTSAFYRNTTINTTILDVKNNIFYNERNVGGPHYAMSSVSVVNFSNNNNLFVSSSLASPIEYPVGTVRTLAGWNILAGNPANNLNNTNTQLSSSQLFTNITNGDLSSSCCRISNMGSPVTITNDFYNVTRSSSTPDIGSTEFGTVSGNPVITNQPTVPSAVCSTGGSASITLLATGFNLSYQWLVNNGTGWAPITNGIVYSGATTSGLSITNPSSTYNNYRYRCLVSGLCTPSVNSDSVTLSVTVPITTNTISSSQTICSGNTPASISGSTPTGGNGSTYSYQWLSSTSSATTGFANAGGTSTLQNYSPSALTQTTWYRRLVISGACASDTALAILITVNPPISLNSLTSSQTICTGNTPSLLSGSTPFGGNGTYTYQWQSSTTSASSGFSNASGTSTSQNYAPPALTQTTWYRRVVSSGSCLADTSSAVQIFITTVIANNYLPGNQVAAHTFSNTVSSWSNSLITTAGGATLLTSTSSTDDDVVYPTVGTNAIGFTFTWCGVSYTNFSVSSNGYLQLGGNSGAYNYPNSTSYAAGFFELFSGDLQGSGLTTSTISYQVIGTSPNRSLIVQWRDWSWYTGNSTSNIINGQIRIGEDGSVKYIYGNCTPTGSYSVGVNLTGISVSDYAFLSGTNWVTPTVSNTVTNTSMSMSSTIKPDTGRTYTWANMTICSGNTPSSIIGSSPSGGNGSTYTYLWLNSTVSATSGFSVAGGTNTGQNYSPSALTQTTWFKRVVTSGVCGADTSIAVPIIVNAPPAIPTALSNTPICTNGSISLSTATVSGATYAWTGPNSFTSTSQNPTISSATSSNTGVYSVTLTIGGCTSLAGTTSVAVNNPGTWTGTVSTAWNNTANWSCPSLPTTSTNVLINAATNMPVITDAQVANNLTIGSGASLTLNVSASQLSIYGNITNNGTLLNTAGEIIFAGTSSQTIPSATYSKITVNNSTGVTLGGAITLTDSLKLTNGNVSIGKYNLTLSGTTGIVNNASASKYILTNDTGFLVIQNIGSGGRAGTVLFPVGTGSSYNPVTVSGSSILTNYIVRVMDSISESGGFSLPKRTNYVVNKRWLVYAAGNTATVSFQWNASDELTGFNRSSSYIAMYSFGGFPWGWTSVATTGTNPYLKTRTGIIANYPGGLSALGSFGIASNLALLPVELISFTGKKVDKNVQLDWKTSSEINNDHFDVERSVDGSLFTAIGKVKGNGTSDLIHDYQFTDVSTPINMTGPLYYRLKQVDLDGKETLSNIIQIHLNEIHTNVNIALSPNPFKNNFELSVDSKSASDLLIQVYDVNGKLVMERTSKIIAGMSNQTISELSEYSPGFYYVRTTINGEVFTNKMVKVN